MTMPELTKSSRYDSADVVSTGIRFSLSFSSSALIIFRFLGRGVVDFHAGFGLEGAQRLVASHHDFVAALQTLGDFDVGHSGDARFHLPENRLLAVHHEDALNLILLRVAG